MNDIFDFIIIKNVQINLLLRTLVAHLKETGSFGENFYVSILPPLEKYSLLEFADFLPVSRYRDVKAIDYVKPLSKSFNKTFYVHKNPQFIKSKYQKYINGKLELEYKKEEALEKGMKYDLILEYDQVLNHILKVWSKQPLEKEEQPQVFQIVKDKVLLESPVELDYVEFYGER